MEPIYKNIPGFDSHYLINEYGQIMSTFFGKNKHITPRTSNSGYLHYYLKPDDGSKYSNHLAHRLVMLAFKGDSGLEVNHIDGNKINNHISNLEYCTRSENHLHAYKVLGRVHPRGNLGKFKLTKSSHNSL